MLRKYALSVLCIALLPFVCQYANAQRLSAPSFAGSPATELDWGIETVRFSEYETLTYLTFNGAFTRPETEGLPWYGESRKVKTGAVEVDVRLQNPVFETLSSAELALIENEDEIPTSILPEGKVSKQRGTSYAMISFLPLRRNPSSGQLEKLVSFSLEVNPVAFEQQRANRKSWSSQSILNSGEWYRISIPEDGVYKIDHQFLAELGYDSLTSSDINIYGNGFGMLPYDNSEWRPDDLSPVNIQMMDSGDNSFDEGDYFLFYANGPHTWNFDDGTKRYSHVTNLFVDSAYYFIGIGVGPAARIPDMTSTSQAATHNVNSFDAIEFHENDWINLVKSGREWYGEDFDDQANESYTFSFVMPDLDQSAMIRCSVSAVAKTNGTTNSSTFNVGVSGSPANSSFSIQGVSSNYTSPAGIAGGVETNFIPNGSNVSVNIAFDAYDPSAVGWLNFIELQGRRFLNMGNSDVLLFSDGLSTGVGNVAEYTLTNTNGVDAIWEVTDPNNIRRVVTAGGGNSMQFRLASDSLRRFIAFKEDAYLTPGAAGPVANQNLHGVGEVDMVIVAHPDFWTEANDLAQFRRDNDSLTVEVVQPQWVYNEFSSGMQDITAIKDFMRMLYERANGNTAQMPRYLLLFGDGSYDNKNRISGNTNFIPTYQSSDSWTVLYSHVSDDYFGFLDLNESDNASDLVDLGIGRLPVKTVSEAQAVVAKLKQYARIGSTANGQAGHCGGTNATTYGDWRNVIVMIADDEDGNTHLVNSEQHSNRIEANYPDMNVLKVYLDAYKQESTPGGERYPDAADAIHQRVQKGALIVNYTGHGGEVGWAHERILDVPTILSWDNLNTMPLFVTATCEFSRFDDPARTSAGEFVLLNENGGGIGLLTTTRLVFSSPNRALNDSFYNYAMTEINGERLRFGDLCMYTKRAVSSTGNNRRNFSLLGDPSTTLAYPEYNVVTTEINGNAVGGQLDTLRALSQVTVRGYVSDENGVKLTNYNGFIYPTVYDKASNITTLGNNSTSSPTTFSLTKNVIYKGKASVTNGDFTFSFVVPKDIAYNYAAGRISYYAENSVSDANGFSTDFIVGGSAENVANDEQGPQVNLFMNDENFVTGGMTDENPVLLAKVFDENGINTVGNGIGHDITAVLDANTDDAIVLNDFYESDLDTYKSGSVTYPFSKLDQGTHTLTFKIWDVYNNSSELTLDFVVVEAAELALSHVLNYPNPFTTNTSFYFEHNQVCEWMDVQVQVFTVSGKLVKTINNIVYTSGFKADPIEWDGKDDFGDNIGRGVYVYRVKVRTPDGQEAETFEKLVILK